MSMASSEVRASICLRISCVQGSAPNMPMRKLTFFGSMPCFSISSAIASM